MDPSPKIVPPTTANILRAAEALRAGELVAIPTETVYGLAADATNEAAVKKIFALKGRPAKNPLIIHVADKETALAFGDFSNNSQSHVRFLKLLDSNLMPGPLSCIVPKASTIAPSVCAGLQTVCIRIPQHPVALQLLQESNLALAAPSANRSTEISPSSAGHVLKSFGAAAPMILDGGNCTIGLESTVVDLTSKQVRILRAGAVDAETLSNTLGEGVIGADKKHIPSDAAAPSPGLLFAHYKPKTKLCRLEDYNPQLPSRAGVILFSEKPGFQETTGANHSLFIRYASRSGDLQEVARNLYSLLHELDSLGLAALYVDSCMEEGIGTAIMDRIRRAIAE